MQKSLLQAKIEQCNRRISMLKEDIAIQRQYIMEIKAVGLGTADARLALALAEHSLEQELKERGRLQGVMDGDGNTYSMTKEKGSSLNQET